jgi:hypothetical protein
MAIGSFRDKSQQTPFQRIQSWRAKQYAFNQNRLNQLNTVANTVFSAGVSTTQAQVDLAVKQATARLTQGVNKLA